MGRYQVVTIPLPLSDAQISLLIYNNGRKQSYISPLFKEEKIVEAERSNTLCLTVCTKSLVCSVLFRQAENCGEQYTRAPQVAILKQKLIEFNIYCLESKVIIRWSHGFETKNIFYNLRHRLEIRVYRLCFARVTYQEPKVNIVITSNSNGIFLKS